MTQEEKAKAYDEAIERAKKLQHDNAWVTSIFPELAESEDERIRKAIYVLVRQSSKILEKKNQESMLAWLEKQGEQKQHLELKAGHRYFCHQAYCARADVLTVKEGETFRCEEDGIVKGFIIKEPEKYFREISTSTDKLEPKFKVGDWVTNGIDFTFQVRSIEDNMYLRSDEYFIDIETADKTFRLWTIQDAKDGDVLYLQHEGKEHVIIYKGLVKKNFSTVLSAYCAYNGVVNDFCFADVSSYTSITSERDEKEIYPATKEQRDQLEKAMVNAGYKWNKEELKLEKI